MRRIGLPRRLQTLPIAFVLIALSACGSSPTADQPRGSSKPASPNKPAPIFTYQGDDRKDKLVAGAKEEGELVWYTSLAGDVVTAIKNGFQDDYPSVQVKVYRAPETEITEKVTQENRVGNVRADVFETPAAASRILADSGVLSPFFLPTASNIPKQFRKTRDGFTIMAADRVSYISFGYNTDALKQPQIPGKFTDLLNPSLKGHMAIASSTTGVRWIGSVYEKFGQKRATRFFQKLAKQNVQVQGTSGKALFDFVAQGQAASSMAIYRNHGAQLKRDGRPVDWTPLEPVTANVGYVSVNGQAAHPNAAALFAQYLLGPKGQKVYKQQLYDTPTEPVDFKVWIPEDSYRTPKAYGDAFEDWQKTFDKTFTR